MCIKTRPWLCRDPLTCCPTWNYTGYNGISTHMAAANAANGCERGLPKWETQRTSLYAPAQRLWWQNWACMPVNKDPLWTETVWQRVEYRIGHQVTATRVQVIVIWPMCIHLVQRRPVWHNNHLGWWSSLVCDITGNPDKNGKQLACWVGNHRSWWAIKNRGHRDNTHQRLHHNIPKAIHWVDLAKRRIDQGKCSRNATWPECGTRAEPRWECQGLQQFIHKVPGRASIPSKHHTARYRLCSEPISVVHHKSEYAAYNCTKKSPKISIRDQNIWDYLQFKSLMPSNT